MTGMKERCDAALRELDNVTWGVGDTASHKPKALAIKVAALITDLREAVEEAERANSRLRQRVNLAVQAHTEAQAHLTEAMEVVRAIKAWAPLRCPCEDEKPDPCPVCGATVAEGICKPGERLPDALATSVAALIAKHGGDHIPRCVSCGQPAIGDCPNGGSNAN